MLKKVSEHWGGPEYPGRRAEILYDKDKGCFTVRFYKKRTIEDLVEERDMVTDGVIHSERYAEDAAENWCLGYIP